MYEIGKQHGTSQSSDIKTYLDNWYANYTDLNKTGTKITDQIYCNDRTASTSESGTAGEISSWASNGTAYFISFLPKYLTDTVPLCSSFSPTTSVYGILCVCALYGEHLHR